MIDFIKHNKDAVLATISTLALVFVFVMSVKAMQPYEKAVASAAPAIETKEKIFPKVEIEASSAVVYDSTSKQFIFQKNPDALLPLASITKLFLSIIINEFMDPSEVIKLTPEDIATEGYSFLDAGNMWRVGDLLRFTLFVSSNDGAAALARKLSKDTKVNFLTLMNSLKEELDLDRVSFFNPSGLDLSDTFSGAYGSASDVAKATSYVVTKYPETANVTTKTKYIFHDLSGNVYEVKNTNPYIESIFGATFSKTGFTDLAGGNLAVAFELEPGHNIVIVVLNSSKEGRFEDVLKLYNATLQYYKN